MPRPSEDDREAVDRAFAELIAGYHLTSDRPDPLAEARSAESATASVEEEPTAASWADDQPLFNFPAPAVQEEEPQLDTGAELEERFVPEPLAPLPRPAWPVLLAWIAMGYAVLAVLAATLGLNLPAWAAWSALIGFVGGFGILVTRLPRHRPPDAGDGAVL